MPDVGAKLLPGRRIPGPRGIVIASCKYESAIGREGHRSDNVHPSLRTMLDTLLTLHLLAQQHQCSYTHDDCRSDPDFHCIAFLDFASEMPPARQRLRRAESHGTYPRPSARYFDRQDESHLLRLRAATRQKQGQSWERRTAESSGFSPRRFLISPSNAGNEELKFLTSARRQTKLARRKLYPSSAQGVRTEHKLSAPEEFQEMNISHAPSEPISLHVSELVSRAIVSIIAADHCQLSVCFKSPNTPSTRKSKRMEKGSSPQPAF